MTTLLTLNSFVDIIRINGGTQKEKKWMRH